MEWKQMLFPSQWSAEIIENWKRLSSKPVEIQCPHNGHNVHFYQNVQLCCIFFCKVLSLATTMRLCKSLCLSVAKYKNAAKQQHLLEVSLHLYIAVAHEKNCKNHRSLSHGLCFWEGLEGCPCLPFLGLSLQKEPGGCRRSPFPGPRIQELQGGHHRELVLED